MKSKVKQHNLSGKDAFDLGIGGLLAGFGGMMGANDYGERKVARYDGKKFTVDTAYASDTGFYETGIKDNRFREDGEWIIVDECEKKGEAKKMHQKWVSILRGKLPDEISDIHSEEVYHRKESK